MTKYIFDVETLGLDPISDRIICISLKIPLTTVCISYFGESEIEILTSFWNLLEETDEIFSFNGDKFDIPFIVMRSVINNIKVKKFNHIDLRKVCNSWKVSFSDYTKGTLRDWAKILNIVPTTSNGSEMIKLFQNNEWDKIKSHCEEDVRICDALYLRLRDVGLLT